MIPVLGITVAAVNPEDFKKTIQSIDYPIQTVSILCNNSSFEYFLKIKDLCFNNYVREFIFSFCPYNLGCAGGWNYHIKNNSRSNYWLLASDDVIYGSRDLEAFDRSSKMHDITFNRYVKSGGGKYSFFSLSENCIEKIGFFDENIYPAYFEDDDYDRRITRQNLSVNYIDVEATHGHEGTIKNLNEDQRRYVKDFLWKKNEEYFKSKIKNNDFSEGKFSLRIRKEKILKIENL